MRLLSSSFKGNYCYINLNNSLPYYVDQNLKYIVPWKSLKNPEFFPLKYYFKDEKYKSYEKLIDNKEVKNFLKKPKIQILNMNLIKLYLSARVKFTNH